MMPNIRLVMFMLILSIFSIDFVHADFSSDSNGTSEWRMFGRYNNRTRWDGVSYQRIPGLYRTTYTTSDVLEYSSPSVVNGYVYIGNSGNKVYQFNASNVSQLIASYTTAGFIDWSSPVIANGYLYIGSQDNRVYQLNASNISRSYANYTTGGQLYSSPAVANGYVYIGSSDNKVYQLNASNISRLVNTYQTIGDIRSSPAVANDYVYIGADNLMYQLNASNISRLIAKYYTGDKVYSSPAVANGYVYFGSYDNRVYQLNASNVSLLIANYTTEDLIDSSPAVAYGYVYIGSNDKKVYQLNASNISQFIASYTTEAEVYSSPAVADGYVYIGGYDQAVYQLNASNVSIKAGNYTTGNAIYSAPAVANGYVYIGSSDKKIYQLNASNVSYSTPSAINLAVSLNWPSDGYSNSTSSPVNVTFNCSATDDVALVNISLYITNSTNQSFTLNQTKNITGTSNSTTWTLDLINGNYTWNCLAYSSDGNSSFASANRTMTINYTSSGDTTAPQLNFTDPTPANATTTTNTFVQINVSIIEQNLSSLNYNWNGTNYSFYDNSLLLSFNFDNLSSLGENDSLARDSSRYGNNGTIYNATWNASGKYGGAVQFDGTKNNNITIPDSPSLRPQNLTVSFWFKASSVTYSSYAHLLFKQGAASYTAYGTWLSPLGALYFETGGGSHGLTGGTVVTNRYYHVAATYDGTTQVIYLDGKLNASEVDAGISITHGDYPLYIGSGDFNLNFNGSIDEVRIWNRSLTAAEVYQQYASNLKKFNLTQWYLIVNQSKNSTLGLTNGSYTYEVSATDASGNSNSTEQRIINIGNISSTPSVSIISNQTVAGYGSGWVRINWSATDSYGIGSAIFNITNPSAGWLYSSTSSSGYVDLGPQNLTMTGSYFVKLFANNTQFISSTTNVTFNVTSPSYFSIEFSSPTLSTGNYSRSDIPVTVKTLNGAYSTIELFNSSGRYNFSNATGTPQSVTFAGLPDGTYKLNATVTDVILRRNYTETRTVNLVTSSPVISLLSPRGALNTSDNNITFQYNVTSGFNESLSCFVQLDNRFNFVAVSNNQSVISNQNISYNMTGFENRTYQWFVNCTDPAGNSGQSQRINFTIDQGPPVLTIQNPPDLSIAGYYVYIRTTVSESVTAIDTAKFEILNITDNTVFWNGTLNQTDDWDSAWNSTSYAGLESNFTLRVTVNDTVGNIVSKNLTFFLDNNLPSVQVLLPLNKSYVGRSFNLSIITQDMTLANATYNISYSDGTLIQNNTQEFATTVNTKEYHDFVNLSNYVEGNYTLYIEAIDGSDNRRRSYTLFTVDRIQPEVALNAPVEGYKTNATVMYFNWTGKDNVSSNVTCNLSINGKVYESGVVSVSNQLVSRQVTGLTYASYAWNVSCLDWAGNINDPATKQFIPDFFDKDLDNVADAVDRLDGNTTSVSVSGVSQFSARIANTDNLTTFENVTNVVFFSGSTPLINFTHNFTQRPLSLYNVTVQSSSTYLIVNISDQLLAQFNKSIYLTNTGFNSLCVKDADIASVSEISDNCDKIDEINFTTCLKNTTPQAIGGITCVENNNIITISNLRYSGAKGGSASGSGSSGGGGGGGGGGSVCRQQWECTNWGACINGYQTRSCKDTVCGSIIGMPNTQLACGCAERWTCDPWSPCTNGTQTRTCMDGSSCATAFSKPSTDQKCGLRQEPATTSIPTNRSTTLKTDDMTPETSLPSIESIEKMQESRYQDAPKQKNAAQTELSPLMLGLWLTIAMAIIGYVLHQQKKRPDKRNK